MLDYYLQSAATGPVTLEILDAGGATLRTFTSDVAQPSPPSSAANRIPNTSALWRPTPEPFSAGAGMHRVVWLPVAPGGGGGGRGGATRLVGEFTARLTVNGKSYSQTLTVRPDPRSR